MVEFISYANVEIGKSELTLLHNILQSFNKLRLMSLEGILVLSES